MIRLALLLIATRFGHRTERPAQLPMAENRGSRIERSMSHIVCPAATPSGGHTVESMLYRTRLAATATGASAPFTARYGMNARRRAGIRQKGRTATPAFDMSRSGHTATGQVNGRGTAIGPRARMSEANRNEAMSEATGSAATEVAARHGSRNLLATRGVPLGSPVVLSEHPRGEANLPA